jgi:hypothetical protein
MVEGSARLTSPGRAGIEYLESGGLEVLQAPKALSIIPEMGLDLAEPTTSKRKLGFKKPHARAKLFEKLCGCTSMLGD